MSSSEKVYKIVGIDCASCAKTLENDLKSLSGVEDTRVNIANKKIYITYSHDLVSEEKLKKRIQKSGYSIFEEKVEESAKKRAAKSSSLLHLIVQQKAFYTTVLSGILLLIGVILRYAYNLEPAARALIICSALIGGIFIAKKAFFSILNLRLDINLLMIVAAIASIIIGEEIEGASIVFLFSVAELAEEVSIDRSRRSIEDLINYAPEIATMLVGESEQIVPAEEVPIGAKILVKAGDRIPLDGVVSAGTSSVNQASITGESMPVEKKVGEEVFAGTLVEDGILTIEVTKDYNNIFLRKIVELVENSDQRAPIERFVDTFAKYYTPIMFIVALITIFLPPAIMSGAYLDLLPIWVKRGLVILVISCPCAVVLSTPITIVAAISRSAKNGVLIKGGSFIESLSKTKVVAFDKTGTLTVGHPMVEKIIGSEDLSEKEILQICGSLELNSSHPIAKAIVEEMEKQKIKPLEIVDFKTIAGKGIKGLINGKDWLVGNMRLFQEEHIPIDDAMASEIALLQAENQTVVLIGNKEKVVGIISVRDQLKDHAIGLVQELRDLGIQKTIMLTGDNSKTAHIMAQQLNIDEVYAELLPDEKLNIINKLQDENENVVMLGDGINDAPALAHAEVGIALGAQGSDIALESADVALMTDSFDSLHYLISIGRKAMRIIKENIIFAILVKLVLFVLTYFGFIDLWMAVLIGDMGVSLLVIFNALLRARGKKMSHEYCETDNGEKCIT
ncbi:MAG: cation-translocating P-type ATPase [Candidatus Heimdallarchaeota archaeon]|nr:cation-translocating P-type ATPase [Candidatus Heimdallarchaeota archaeon]